MRILPVIEDEESYEAAAGPMWAYRILCWLAAMVVTWGALRLGVSWPPIAALAVSIAAAIVTVMVEQRRIEYRFQRDNAKARESLD